MTPLLLPVAGFVTVGKVYYIDWPNFTVSVSRAVAKLGLSGRSTVTLNV